MITFTQGLDKRTREVPPQVAKILTANGLVYCVVGTDYGHIHTTGGDVRTWKSYSGAKRFLDAYQKDRK